MVGRIFIFNLYQLDFAEFLSYKDPELYEFYNKELSLSDLAQANPVLPRVSELKQKELDRLVGEFMVYGAYPRVILAKSQVEKKEVLKNIYQTYFLRDIKDIVGLIDDYKLVKLIKALALQAGQLVEYNELGQISGYDYITLKKYLNILEKTFICRPVRPFFRNKRTELKKNPKIYFFDSGLRNSIIGDFNLPDSRADKGALVENFVFSELIKQGLDMNYWRTKQKAEVNFVIQTSGAKLLPMEVKSHLSVSRISASFRSFVKTYSPKKAVVFNQGYLGKEKSGQTEFYFLPFWMVT